MKFLLLKYERIYIYLFFPRKSTLNKITYFDLSVLKIFTFK